MKQTADENIKKYYADKGYQGVTVKITEERDPKTPNSESLTIRYRQGHQSPDQPDHYLWNESNFCQSRLKKQMDDTKEVTKLTLFPAKDSSSYGVVNPMTFKEYIDQQGFLSYTKTKEFIDPYFRFKLIQFRKIQ